MMLSRMVRAALTVVALYASAGHAAAVDPAKGKQVYDHWCAPCHGRGPGHPGTQSLAIKYHGAIPDALEDRKDLTPRIVAMYVREGVQLMPFFRKTEVSDRDLADLSAYLAKEK